MPLGRHHTKCARSTFPFIYACRGGHPLAGVSTLPLYRPPVHRLAVATFRSSVLRVRLALTALGSRDRRNRRRLTMDFPVRPGAAGEQPRVRSCEHDL